MHARGLGDEEVRLRDEGGGVEAGVASVDSLVVQAHAELPAWADGD